MTQTRVSGSDPVVDTHRIQPYQLVNYFASNRIFAEQICKIEFGLGGKPSIGLGILSAQVSVGRKLSLDIPFSSSAFVMSIVRSGSLHFFEASRDVLEYGSLREAIIGISKAPGRHSGRPTLDIYAATPRGPEELSQFVIDASKPETALEAGHRGRPGIVSVRTLGRSDTLVAIICDPNGRGTSIGISRVAVHTDAVTDMARWTLIAFPPTDRDFVALSRPKTGTDGRTKFVVGLEGGYRANLTLTPDGRGYRVEWGAEIPCGDAAIGTTCGIMNIFASYEPAEKGPPSAKLDLSPVPDDSVSRAYMLA